LAPGMIIVDTVAQRVGLDHGVGHLGSMTAPDRQRLDPTEA